MGTILYPVIENTILKDNNTKLIDNNKYNNRHNNDSLYPICAKTILTYTHVSPQYIYIIELAQLSCIWTEVLQITNLMLSCRGVYSPARRAPLRGERHWRGAAAAQNKHYVIISLLINYYFLHFFLFLNFNFYFLICFKLFYFH